MLLYFTHNVWRGVDASSTFAARCPSRQFFPNPLDQSLTATHMTTGYVLFAAAAAFAAALAMQAGSAQALTITECSEKFKEAKAAGSLSGKTLNDFRNKQCGSDGRPKAAKAAATAPPAAVVANAVF